MLIQCIYSSNKIRYLTPGYILWRKKKKKKHGLRDTGTYKAQGNMIYQPNKL